MDDPRADAHPRPRKETISWAERWISDGIDVAEVGAGIGVVEVDMTAYKAWIAKQPFKSKPSSMLAAVVRVAALALQQLRTTLKLAAGYQRLYPDQIDISISVAGRTFLTPMMLLKAVDRKPVSQIVAEMDQEIARVRKEENEFLATLNRWGWLVPFAGLRRGVIRSMMRRWAMREKVGVIQVSQLPNLDYFSPLKLSATALLTMTAIKDRVIAIDGQAHVRPILILSGTFDHKIWDGMCAQRFWIAMKQTLESANLDSIL